MRTSNYFMISFSSTHHALHAEQQLKPKLPVCTMPTLRAVTKSCGISLRVEETERAALKAALLDHFAVPREYYHVFYVMDGLPVEVQPQEL